MDPRRQVVEVKRRTESAASASRDSLSLESRDQVEHHFRALLEGDAEKSAAIAAIETLLTFVEHSSDSTINGLQRSTESAVRVLKATDYSTTSVSSASELFMLFITLTSLEEAYSDFTECKKALIQRGQLFLENTRNARAKIAQRGPTFIRNGMTILTHSHSRVVFEALRVAAGCGRRFTVYVTESLPDRAGVVMQKKLEAEGIPCVLILDCAVAYVMDRVNFVLVGAEGVVENGGIINKIGTYGIALCAKALNKPVYVMAESVKFLREFPLSQRDIDNSFKYRASTLREKKDLTHEHPLVDYTGPENLSLIFTDLGVLTPTAVSDEIIKLYL